MGAQSASAGDNGAVVQTFPFYSVSIGTHTEAEWPELRPEIEVIAADGRPPTSVKWRSAIISNNRTARSVVEENHTAATCMNINPATITRARTLARNYRKIVTVSNANIHSVQPSTRMNRAPVCVNSTLFAASAPPFAAGAECLVDVVVVVVVAPVTTTTTAKMRTHAEPRAAAAGWVHV